MLKLKNGELIRKILNKDNNDLSCLYLLKQAGALKISKLPITQLKKIGNNLEVIVVPKSKSLTLDYKTLKFKLGNSFVNIKSKKLKERIIKRTLIFSIVGILPPRLSDAIVINNSLTSKQGFIRKLVIDIDLHNSTRDAYLNPTPTIGLPPIWENDAVKKENSTEVEPMLSLPELMLKLNNQYQQTLNKVFQNKEVEPKPKFKCLGEDLSYLIGKTIIQICQYENEYLIFKLDNDEYFIMFHNQDCCENVYIEDIVGELKNLIGKPLLRAEVKSSDKKDGTDLTEEEAYYKDGDETWTFYTFATMNGYVDLRWYGESNGYYSTSVDSYIITGATSYAQVAGIKDLPFSNRSTFIN